MQALTALTPLVPLIPLLLSLSKARARVTKREREHICSCVHVLFCKCFRAKILTQLFSRGYESERVSVSAKIEKTSVNQVQREACVRSCEGNGSASLGATTNATVGDAADGALMACVLTWRHA